MPRSRSRVARTGTRSSSRSRRSPRPGSTTSRSATGTARRWRRPRASPTPTRARPRPIAVDQDKAGKVLLVTLDEQGRRPHGPRRGAERRQDVVRAPGARRVDDRVAARVHREAQGPGEPGPRPRRPAHRRPARTSSTSSRTEVEAALKASFLKVRIRDASQPALTEGAIPSAETITGAFIRNVEGRIADLEASGDTMAVREAEELRDVLRLGRLLLAGHEVTL